MAGVPGSPGQTQVVLTLAELLSERLNRTLIQQAVQSGTSHTGNEDDSGNWDNAPATPAK
mgnify:CR=1 FL=1